MNSDTIYRQAAVSRISDLLMLELKGERIPTWNEVYRAIQELPSAEKHARWIPNTGGFSCSNCGHQTDDDEIGNWDITFGKWVYCPHCGARMDEVS